MSKKSSFLTLYKYESFKILKNKVALVTFLILLAFSFMQSEFEVRGNVEPEVLKKYGTLSGRKIDDELISEAIEVSDDAGRITDDAGVAYADLADWLLDVSGSGYSFAELNSEKIYRERELTIEEAYELSRLSEEERDYWKEAEKEIGKPFIYHDTVITAGVLEGTSNCMIMMLIIISTGLSSVFAMETQRKTDPMIRATLRGNRELYFAKLLAGTTYTIAGILMLLTVFYISFGIRWGFDGLNCAIQTYRPFSQMNLTAFQLAGILVMLTILGSILLSAFALLISAVTRNALATMAIAIGTHLALFAASSMIPYNFRALSQLTSLFPATLVSSRLVYEFRMISMGKLLRCYQAAPILYILLTAVFVILGYLHYAKYEIKNN